MSDESLRLLIVESSDADREQYKNALVAEGFEPEPTLLEARAGKEAVRLCLEDPPDCIVVAEKLADMEATAFLDELAGEDGFVALPVIVVIARRSRKAVNDVLARGARDWLPKDQAAAVLPRAVRYVVDRKGEDLRAAEQRVLFRALLTGTPGLLVLKNQNLQYEAVNPAFCQFIGKAPEEVAAATDGDLFPKEDAESLEAEDRKALSVGVPHTKVQHVGPKGNKHWLEISRSPITDVAGEVTGLLWTARDITEFKEMEDAVRESGEPLRTLSVDQSEIACRFDTAQAVSFVNEPFCRFLGKSRDELLGQDFLALLPEEEQKPMKDHLAALTPEQPVADREIGAVSAEGDICWQHWTTRALFTEDGQLTGYQAVGRDVTDRQRAEDALADRERRLQALDQQVETALAEKERQVVELQEQASQAQAQLAEQQGALAEKDAQLEQLAGQAVHVERRLKDLELRLASVLNLFPVPYCELGSKTRVTLFNQATIDTLGFSQDDFAKGINLVDLFHPDDKARATDALRAVIEGKSVEPGDYRMLCKDRSELTVRLMSAPIVQDDKIVGLRCCLMNLVDRRRMQAALDAASQMAAATLKAASLSQNVGELMSASLRNMAQGGAEAVPDAGKLDELQGVLGKVDEFVQQIRAAFE